MPARPTDHIVKRSVVIHGHKTSVSLEDAFWRELTRLAQQRGLRRSAFISAVDLDRQGRSLSSSLRIAVLVALQAELAMFAGAIATRLAAPQDGTRPDA